MITSLQTFFLKHNKWLFSALLVVIIVTFVLTIGNQSFFGGSSTVRAESREYYGYDLNSSDDLQAIGRNGAISAQLHPELGIRGPNLQQYSILRVSALGLANELGIQPPNSEQLEDYIQSLAIFQSPGGEGFDAERYNQFRSFMAARMGGEASLAKVLREDYRIAQVREAFAGPGYVVPFSIEQQYEQSETTWDVALAQRAYADFQPELDPDEETLRALYEADPARFSIPEKMEVSAARFQAEAFLDQVPAPTDSELEQYFNRYRFRYSEPPAEGETEPAEVTLDAVRDEVVADYREEQARQLAQDASDQFATALYENQVARDSEAFTRLLEEYNGTLEPLPPFSRENPPLESGIDASAFNSMWIHATGDRYFSDIAPTADGAALLILEEVHPETIPLFEKVTAAVEEAWIAEERRRLFAEAAQEWESEIKQALAGGTSFQEAAEAAGFTVSDPEPFLRKETPVELSRLQLASELTGLGPEEASPIVLTRDSAAMVYVEEMERPEVDSQSAEYTAFLESELQARRDANGWSALNAWTDRTLQVSAPEAPREG